MGRKWRLDITPGALAATIILLILVLLVGAGNLIATFEVNQSGIQRVCNGFSYFIKKPEPPINTEVKQHQLEQWQKLQIFNKHLGCH